jgi:1-acyl-sn-glycerol-3-phosphate acyltransferase
MKFLKRILVVLYRIWFYILVTIPIVALFPLLLITILKERWYPAFFWLARVWARIILFGMGYFPIIKRDIVFEKSKNYLFVSNHTSMTDIMLMLHITKNPFVFVGKAELAKIPVFGFFYKRTCILVDRNSPKSRRAVFESAQRKLNMGYSVCIFPEGGVPDEEKNILLDEFKDGAFRLAIEHKIPIAPMTFHDNRYRLSYEFTSIKASPGKMRVKVHPVIPTKILELEDKRKLKMDTRDIILEELKNPSL